MRKYKTETTEVYNHCVKTLLTNKTNFIEHSFGSRKTIIINKTPMVSCVASSSLSIGDIEKNMFNSFLANFNKNLYKNLRENESLIDKKIVFKGFSRNKNLKVWDSIADGTYFYNIDLKSAYWQIAKRLEYIDETFYQKYKSDMYKKVKRYCISFLARKNKATYYDSNKVRTIECDNNLLKSVYDNIRNELYICVAKAVKSTNGKYIEFNIDGLNVLAKQVDSVCKVFNELGLEFKMSECRKINEFQYEKLGELRTFKKQTI
jgi:transposase